MALSREAPVTPLMLLAAPWQVSASGIGATLVGGLAGGLSASADIGAVIGGLAGAVAVVISLIVTSRNNQRRYEQDIRDAEDRGYERAVAEKQPWIDYYKDALAGRLRLPPDPPEQP